MQRRRDIPDAIRLIGSSEHAWRSADVRNRRRRWDPPCRPATFAEAEKLAQVTLTDAQRAMAASSWRTSMAFLLERRAGPRKVPIDASVAPATKWNPALPERENRPLARSVRAQRSGLRTRSRPPTTTSPSRR